MLSLRNILMTLLLLPTLPLSADFSDQGYDDCTTCPKAGPKTPFYCAPHIISIGPEIYRIHRSRQGGTRQKGTPIGIRATYDYIKRYHIYFGAQAFYGNGTLKGHTGSGDLIRSRLTDKMIEGYVGYTFQGKCYPYFAWTPYIGYGYMREINKFSPPSPLEIKFTTQFRYFAFGFLSSIYLSSDFTIGLNARFKAPWQSRCKVSNDPEFDHIRQQIEDRIHYRIELPITYIENPCCHWFYQHLQAAIAPFYERRLYGKRENFPFDFFETKFHVYGVNIQLIYRF